MECKEPFFINRVDDLKHSVLQLENEANKNKSSNELIDILLKTIDDALFDVKIFVRDVKDSEQRRLRKE